MNQQIKQNWLIFLRKLPSLFFGLYLFAIGVVCTLNSNLGMSPWGVLQLGITNHTPLTLGQVSQLVGLAVLLLGWLMGFPPGFATIMNMYFIGYWIDQIIAWDIIPVYDNLVGQLALMTGGMGIIGIASFFYLNAKLGAGPRDGLMMGLIQKMDYPISYIRGGIEMTVLVMGIMTGGPFGIGTLITALTTGYAVQLAFKIGKYDRKAVHLNLYTLTRFLQGKN